MLNSLFTSLNTDGSTHIKYTYTFTKMQHIIYGEFDASQEDTTKAQQAAKDTDSWAGFKQLVLTRLKTEATNALGGGTSE
ncbi:hypothetical protein H3M12_12245 (plasmid) [Levilactobacillus suantsaii]|uniref:hypothetical protein n=1 Tax=Levilactobacillus suantsaii TaxID=2292255 RepID=UPI0015F72497|nr:hypothetical protein [Levilactobacillus suantsaii]QMU09320.1 hypothetical protein H3M12_12245 [Levilactobacillus suantsaii]